ncbi:hypothetical protein, partial [Sphingobium xanthum]|uniref:hypothetical protein n=1 Tax=Sphingobium xanthum TaxID=1387165 RepID=UPI003D25841E
RSWSSMALSIAISMVLPIHLYGLAHKISDSPDQQNRTTLPSKSVGWRMTPNGSASFSRLRNHFWALSCALNPNARTHCNSPSFDWT